MRVRRPALGVVMRTQGSISIVVRTLLLTMNKDKTILDLCGGTGSWSRPYRAAGYDVQVVTLPDNDVRLYVPPNNVHGILAAPPCTEFSYAKHFHGKGKYSHNWLEGLEVVSACMRVVLTANPVWWALENPRGYLVKWLGEPAFEFDPWQYGDPYQKKTCLWGKFTLPPQQFQNKPENAVKFSMLKSREIHPEYYGILSRQERRAITPQGFANAFFLANQ